MNMETLHDNIESQIFKFRRNFLYDTREGDIEYITEQYEKGYDRLQYSLFESKKVDLHWSNIEKSKFIESIIIGIPISHFVFIETKDLSLEIIDGKKRIETLYEFTRNLLKLEGLEKLTFLNGLTFNELRSRKKIIFLKTHLRYIYVSSESSNEMIEYIRKLNNGVWLYIIILFNQIKLFVIVIFYKDII